MSYLRIVAVVMVALLMVSRLIAQTTISGGTSAVTLPQPGVYVLGGDLVYSGTGNAVAITASGVTFDLNGFRIRGTWDFATTNARGISATGRSDIVIRNGTIEGFRRGIQLFASGTNRSPGGLFEDLTIRNVSEFGIYSEASGLIVRNNIFSSIGGGTVVANLAASGVSIHSGTGVVISGNHIHDVASAPTSSGLSYGLRALNSSDIIILNNTISNSEYGIAYENSTGKFRDNLVGSDVDIPFLGGTSVGGNWVDTDSDGLPDDWETFFFGDLSQTASGDFDDDGNTNLSEFQSNTSPTDYYNGATPSITKDSGDNQSGQANNFLASPLRVLVKGAGNVALKKAPVTFSVAQGGGVLALSGTSPTLGSSVLVKTDDDGYASVAYKQSYYGSTASEITANTGAGASTSFTSTTNNFIAHWKLEEATGSTVADSSTVGNDGGIFGAVFRDVGFEGQRAFVFSGGEGTQGISVSNANNRLIPGAGGAFTLAFWFKTDPVSEGTCRVLAQNYIASTGGFRLVVDNGHLNPLEIGNPRLVLSAVGTGASLILKTTASITPGQWHHVAVTYSGSVGKIYIDGELAGTHTGSLNPNSGEFWFAKKYTAGSAVKNLSGALDDIRIYSNVLTQQEVSALFSVDADENDLPDWWEWKYMGGTGVDPNGDLDGDGVSNGSEYQGGTDPADFFNGNEGFITKVSGDGQKTIPGQKLLSPLVVNVSSLSAPAVNAPVVFQLPSSGGAFSVDGSTYLSETSVTVRTDAAGNASIYFKQPTTLDALSNITASSGGTSVSFTATTQELAAHVRFEESSETAFVDSSGVNNHAAGFATKDVGFEGSQAAKFLGGKDERTVYLSNSDYRVIPEAGKAFSISLWVKPEPLPVGQCYTVMRSENYLVNGFRFALDNGHVHDWEPGLVRFIFWSTQSGGTLDLAPTKPIVAGEWYHLVITYDGTKGRFYINGQLEAEHTGTLIPSTGAIRIGQAIGGSPKDFNGLIDDVRIYAKELSSGEIDQLLIVDGDGNGLPDRWENTHFQSVGNDPDGDPDGDGLTNLQEYQNGSNPHDYFNGATSTVELFSGNSQTSVANTFLEHALAVRVLNGEGVPMVNAPVDFSVGTNGGQLSLTKSGTPTLATSLSVRTDAGGVAQVFYKQPGRGGYSSVISVSSGSASTVSFTAVSDPLITRLSFEGVSPTTAEDSSGAGNHGTITGGSFGTGIEGNQALVFSGTTSIALPYPQVTVPRVFPGNAGVSLWFKLSEFEEGKTYTLLSGGSGFSIVATNHPSAHGGRKGKVVVTNSVSGSPILYSETTLLVDVWYHLLVTASDDNLSARLYLNGVLEGSASQFLNPNTTAFKIGMDSDGGNPFIGTIDDFRIYEKWLPLDVQSIFAVDHDGNGIPDRWEHTHFQTAGIDPNADADGDGLTNLQEFQGETNPLDYFNGATNSLELVSGSNQISVANTFTENALAVRVLNSSGQPMVNAPVDFAVGPNGGNLAISDSELSPLHSTLTVRTNSEGIAEVYYQQPPFGNFTSTVTASSGTASPISFSLQTADLIGRWRFEGPSLTMASDSSGAGNHGTLSGASYGTGIEGSHGLSFSGSSGLALPFPSVTIPSTAQPAFTISFWFNASEIDENSVHTLMARDGYLTNGFRMAINNENVGYSPASKGRLMFWSTENGGNVFMYSNGVIEETKWYHVAVTYNGSTAALYVNGVLQMTRTGIIQPPQSSVQVGTGIGGKKNFKGALDDLRIYGKALSSGEVHSIFYADLNENGLPDGWEIETFNSTGTATTVPPGGDGLSGLTKYLMGWDPNIPRGENGPGFEATGLKLYTPLE